MYGAVPILLALATSVAAKTCKDFMVPVTTSARIGYLPLPVETSNPDTYHVLLDIAQAGLNATLDHLEYYQTVGGNYTIAATYCQPDSGPSDVLQILTHGLGNDHTYWDLAYQNHNYSYTNTAVDQHGYSTFAYDRLGIGQSSKGNPLNELQPLLEVEVLKVLVEDLQAGSIKGINTKFKKTVLVGSGFGSAHSYTLTAMYPNITDAIVLTSFTQNYTYAPYLSLAANWGNANMIAHKWSQLPYEYITFQTASGLEVIYFAPDEFDPGMLAYLFKNKALVALGSLVGFYGETLNTNSFAGPVQVVTGERDVVYCGGNCTITPPGYANIPAAVASWLPNANPFQADVVPNAGHALNAEYTANSTFASIASFLAQNGLAPNKTA